MIARLLPFADHTLARRDDPETSKAAAAQSGALRGAHHEAILRVLLDATRPLTAEQIAAQCGLTGIQVNRRIAELIEHNYIVQDGEGRTASGRRARAFRVQ